MDVKLNDNVSNSVYVNIDYSRIVPVEIDRKEGSDVMFTCHSFAKPKWYFDGIPLNSNRFKQLGNNLYIKNIQSVNQGYYECQGTAEEEQKFAAKSFLKVRGK